jgi:hypothetical protein
MDCPTGGERLIKLIQRHPVGIVSVFANPWPVIVDIRFDLSPRKYCTECNKGTRIRLDWIASFQIKIR